MHSNTIQLVDTRIIRIRRTRECTLRRIFPHHLQREMPHLIQNLWLKIVGWLGNAISGHGSAHSPLDVHTCARTFAHTHSTRINRMYSNSIHKP